jgi:hypothetical protein
MVCARFSGRYVQKRHANLDNTRIFLVRLFWCHTLTSKCNDCVTLQQDATKSPPVWGKGTLHRATFKLQGLSQAVTFPNWHNPQKAGGFPVPAGPAAAAAGQGLSFKSVHIAEEQGVERPVMGSPLEFDMWLHFQPPEVC